MSLVPTWVRMKNSKWYKDPVIYDKLEIGVWYICFDDRDPVEIVIQNPKKQMFKKERKQAIENVIRNLGINAQIIEHFSSGNRMFPPNWDIMTPAISAFIKINSAIDSDKFKVMSEDIRNEVPKEQGVYYEF